tara:strand:+ start:241 stop:348 length:108 start_codon:yes stop_codon:yes gene_type:complete
LYKYGKIKKPKGSIKKGGNNKAVKKPKKINLKIIN